MKHKIILSFEVEAEKQAEVMAIGKAISEHIASLKEVGSFVGVEYGLANNNPNAKIQQPVQKPKNNTGSVNNSKSNNEDKDKRNLVVKKIKQGERLVK